MLSDNVTVFIFAKNEEGRISSCISNFRGLFKRIVVVDNHSVDRTAELSIVNGCEVIQIQNPGFIETPEVMIPVQQNCGTEYLLLASVSEFVPFNLLKYYAEVANTGTFDVVVAYRESITAGLSMPISGDRASKHSGEIRFFKKYSIDYSGNLVHGRGRVMVPAHRLDSIVKTPGLVFYQYRDYDVSHTEQKHKDYNDVLAKQLVNKNIKFSFWKLIYHPVKHFIYSYVRSGCWRYGFLGFIHSYYRFHMEVGIWMRVWELENGLDRRGVLESNAKHRRAEEQRLEKAVQDK